MVNFDDKTVRETLSTTLDEYGVSEEQDGISNMVDALTTAIQELYEKSGGGKKKGKSTPYTRFISHLAKNKEAIADLNVHLSARFGANSGTKALYLKNKDQFEDGTEMTVGDILTGVTDCIKNEPDMKQSQMTKGAFVWNMLDDANRDLVMNCT